MKIITPFMALATTAILSAIMLSVPVFAQENPKLSDAEVASVAVVANQIDIEYGEIAQKKSKNADVLKFAETMIKIISCNCPGYSTGYKIRCYSQG